MSRSSYGLPFMHGQELLRAAARLDDTGWTLTVEDERGRTCLSWRPDPGLVRGRPTVYVPELIDTLVRMVMGGDVPLVPREERIYPPLTRYAEG